MRAILRTMLLPLAAMAIVAAAPAPPPAWDPAPWLGDLDRFRAAIDHDYPNLDWLTGQREVSLDLWFARAADEIRRGGDDAAARRALDRLATRFRDGHLELNWPSPPALPAGAPTVAVTPTSESFCTARGFRAGGLTPGTASALPGYRPIAADGPFPAGMVDHAGRKVGVVRIAVFDPQGYTALCEQAVTVTRTRISAPCDEECADRVLTYSYQAMTRGLMTTIEQLRGAGAELLLVDLTRNGGGTEWAEAAARIVSPLPLRSAPTMVMPGEAWVTRWRELATRLQRATFDARPEDKAMLADLAQQAASTADRLKPCTGPGCARLVQAGYASGLLRELPAGRLDGRPWAPEVFSAAQFPYRDAVWQGPLIVLVDDETWSAAEEFAAVLQDNGAAVVMGTRTGGAGCGHLFGNDPIELPHSGARLELPNCARLRSDGTNEVSGVVPDVPTGARASDGRAYAGRLTAVHLDAAIARAEALRNRPR